MQLSLTYRRCERLILAWYLLAASGCVCPSYCGWCDVSNDVAARTGYDLGSNNCPEQVPAEVMIAWDDGLSEEEAIVVGLWNNPGYSELLADLGLARADVIGAVQLQNPQINTLFPVGPKQWEFTLMFPVDVLWLRPLRVAAAQLESQRVAERLVQDGLNAIRDVRLAYIDWRLAVARARLATEGAALRGEFARIAEARLAAGAVAELDVSATRLDATIGQGDAMRAARDVEIAREQLRFLLGIQLTPIVPRPPDKDAARAELPLEMDVEALVAEAVATRPDLRAAQLAVIAAEERANLAKYDYWNIAAILPDINSRGTKGFEAGPGLQFTLPLFHQNQGAIARFQADAERLRRQYTRMRDAAALEVRRAHAQLLQARNELRIWEEEIIPHAEAAVTSARRALEEDGVSLLLVLETSRQLLTAQERALEADAQLRRAIAELERSIGRRLPVAATPEGEGGMEALVVPLPDAAMPENL
jgi:cobalt-zinc-cadmium efflux system outer membrane protein